MFKAIDSGIVPSKAPVSSTTKAGNMVFMVAIGKDPKTGELVPGGIEPQTRRAIANLKLQVEAAGGSVKDIAQVLIYIINPADAVGMNKAYREVFSEPFPCRATVVVKELLAPGMLIEVVATAVLGPA